MHKFIAGFFSNILTTVHFIVFAAIAFIFYSGFETVIIAGISPAYNFLLIVCTLIAYTLFVGLTSLVIRINQNLERIADRLDDWPDSDDFEYDDDPDYEH